MQGAVLEGRGPTKGTVAPRRTGPTRQRVLLAVTPMGPSFAPFLGYHSSILIGRTEYSFSKLGVFRAAGPQSHRGRDAETTLIDCGRRAVDVAAFEEAVFPLFAPGTYDLLRTLPYAPPEMRCHPGASERLADIPNETAL